MIALHDHTRQRPMLSWCLRYGLALVSTALAAFVRWLLPWALAPAPYLGFYPAVVMSAALGGVGPGLVSAFGSLFLVNFVFGRFNVHDHGAMMRQVIWVVASIGMSLLAGMLRTARQSAEREAAAARTNEGKFRSFFHTAAVGTDELALDGRFIEVNERLCEITGYSREELLSMTPGELTHPDDRQHEDRHLTAYLHGKSPVYESEKRYLRKDGHVIWVQVTAAMVRDAFGKPLRSAGVIQDITGRKDAEEQLRKIAAEMQAANTDLEDSRRAAINLLEDALDARRQAEEAASGLMESEEKLSLALRSADMGVWRLDLSEQKRYFDDQVCHCLGIDPARFSGTAEEFLAAVHPEDRDGIKAALDRTIVNGEPYEAEYRAVWPDGRIRHIAARGRLARDAAGQPQRVDGLVWDITERKQAEERLQASLREKDVMLKEIHHRVKNNLQVISSLVSLQANQEESETVREVLRDVTFRVRSMALVHEKLYQSESLASVDFAEYAQSLLTYLWRAHGSAAVRLTLNMEPLSLPVDTAVPCGLVLNELAGNALKHAFRGRDNGEVTVSLHEDTEGSIRLTVSDNGAGLPPELDWRQAGSLGLRLVQMLATQLNATVELNRSGGTEFQIVFKLPGT